MPKNFSRKTFDAWLEKNIHRFKFKPFISLYRKGYFELHFEGLAQELYFIITKYGCVDGIINNKEGEMDDLIADFTLVEKKTAEGLYYCADCLERIYYPDRTSLWRSHIFERILEWINKIESDDLICLSGSEELGWFSANLIKSNENIADRYHTCIPLVIEALNP